MGSQLTPGQTAQFQVSRNGVPDNNVTWASDAPAVATVAPGPSSIATVTAVAPGSATITGTETVTGCLVPIKINVVASADGPPGACNNMGLSNL